MDTSAEQLSAAPKEGRDDFQPSSPPPTLVFEIVRYRGYWRTRHRNKHSKPYSDQEAAVLAAKALARKMREQGNPVQVCLVRSDGQIVDQPLDGDSDG